MRRRINKEYANYLIGLWNLHTVYDKMEPISSDKPDRRTLSRLINMLEVSLMARGINYGQKV